MEHDHPRAFAALWTLRREIADRLGDNEDFRVWLALDQVFRELETGASPEVERSQPAARELLAASPINWTDVTPPSGRLSGRAVRGQPAEKTLGVSKFEVLEKILVTSTLRAA